MPPVECPRCARRDGIPIEDGPPDAELLGVDGCVLGDYAPDRRCGACGHVWQDHPLPPWWPPVPARDLEPAVYDVAHRALAERTRRTTVVVETLRQGGVDAAYQEQAALLEWLAAQFPHDPTRRADAHLADLVVPTDCMLMAGVLGAAIDVCRAVERAAEPALFGRDDHYSALAAAERAFDRADLALRYHGLTDFTEDEEEDDWLYPEARFEAAVRTGEGSELPAVAEEWDRWLADVAGDTFRGGSALGWARYVWAALAPTGLTAIDTEVDRARAVIRLNALAVLRDECLGRLDEDGSEGSWSVDADDVVGAEPRVDPFFLGVLAATAGVDPDVEVDGEFDEGPPVQYAVTELVRVECAILARAMTGVLGTSAMLASIWASRFTGARYPLSPDALDVALNEDLTPAKHIAFEWIGEGMAV